MNYNQIRQIGLLPICYRITQVICRMQKALYSFVNMLQSIVRRIEITNPKMSF